jgi:protein-disulfide isomerase
MTALLRRASAFGFAGIVAIPVVAVIAWHAAAAQVPAAQPQAPVDRTAEFLRQYEAVPRVTVPVSSGGAVVLIVKFTDYQCPACATTHRMYRPVLEKYEAQFPGAVKLVTKDFPLDKDCNAWLVQTMHPASCDAAVAVALARAQKHGPEMEDWLYSNQQLLTPATVRKAADIIGGVQDFTAGYAQALEQVKADAALGRLLYVNSTPTFFINGAKIDAVLQPELFDAAIAYELRKAGKMK